MELKIVFSRKDDYILVTSKERLGELKENKERLI